MNVGAKFTFKTSVHGNYLKSQIPSKSHFAWTVDKVYFNDSLKYSHIHVIPPFESVDANGMCRWSAVLPPTMDTNPHTITASSQKYGSMVLSDVLFGDVWVCSGQSNMQFALPQVK